MDPHGESVRATARALARGPRVLAQGLWSALLPSPERERFARPRELDAPRWSFELGIVQMFAGVGLFFWGGLAFTRPATTEGSMTLLENWWPGLSTTHFQGLGILNWFAWFLFPASWPFAYLALIGLARCVAFAITREAVGEPLVWAALRVWQAATARLATRRREARLGPVRPDRVLAGKGRDVFVLTCREKPEWTAASTIEITGRFFRLVGIGERSDGAWISIVYHLHEVDIGAGVIRRLVRYEPPPDTSLPVRSRRGSRSPRDGI